MSHTATCDIDPDHTHDVPNLEERSRAGLSAVGLSLLILGLTAAAQAIVFAWSGSAALLADLSHNVGDALTAVPVGLAFTLQSLRAERVAGMLVVAAIVVSMVVAGATAIDKLITRDVPDHLLAVSVSGLIGVVGNSLAARIRSRAGRRLGSAALVADGHHARVDALVSAGVIASAALVSVGLPLADPLIALVITAVIGHIALDAWHTVRHGAGHHDQRSR